MNDSDPRPPRTMPLVANQQLVIEDLPSRNLLRLVGADGRTRFALEITADGPVLRFEGGLAIQTDGPLAIDAAHVALHGREGVAISSGGDAWIDVAGDLHSNARIQNITADLGNVNVKANDDVRLNGERVKVNCPPNG